MPADLVAGDSAPILRVRILDQANQQLTPAPSGCELRWRINKGALQTRTMVMSAAGESLAEYTWVPGDLVVPAGLQIAHMEAEVTALDANGKALTSLDKLYFVIRARL